MEDDPGKKQTEPKHFRSYSGKFGERLEAGAKSNFNMFLTWIASLAVSIAAIAQGVFQLVSTGHVSDPLVRLGALVVAVFASIFVFSDL